MTDPLSEPLQPMNPEQAIYFLGQLLEYYGGQEAEWYQKIWGPEGRYSEGYESEWNRYRCEAGALRAGIAAIRAGLPRRVQP